MSFWDPYDPYRRAQRLREQQRRDREEAERRAREQEALRRSQGERADPGRGAALPPPIIQRFEQELAQARRERDEWEDRYRQALQQLEAERTLLADERARVEAEVEGQREQLRAEADAQRERLLRNAEQRAFEENRKTLTRLLEVADNFERALALAGGEGRGLVEGVQLTHRDFQRALEQGGVTRLASVGASFDPALHEAVATESSPHPGGTILRELSPGYLYRGTLLRPARVVVAEP